jgi:hypothetical protein
MAAIATVHPNAPKSGAKQGIHHHLFFDGILATDNI